MHLQKFNSQNYKKEWINGLINVKSIIGNLIIQFLIFFL